MKFFNNLLKISGTSVESPLPEDVNVQDCDEMPCVFYIGSQTSMTMKFRARKFL